MSLAVRVLGGGLAFGIVIATLIALATGSAQIGLHAGFWLSVVFAFWLESRITASR